MDKTNIETLTEELRGWWYTLSDVPKISFVCTNQPPQGVKAPVSHVEWPRLMVCLHGRRGYHGGAADAAGVTMGAGQGIYFAPGTWIAPRHDPEFRSIGIHWEKEQGRLVLRENDPLRPPKAVLSLPRPPDLPRDWHREVAQAVARPGGRMLAEALLLITFARLTERMETGTHGATRRARDLYMRINAYLEENFAANHSRATVAEHFRISPGHLTRLFRTEGRQGFNARLRTIRLREARQLLVTRSLNIQEVSLRCGFNDPAYFSRAFRKHFGHPPKLRPCPNPVLPP